MQSCVVPFILFRLVTRMHAASASEVEPNSQGYVEDCRFTLGLPNDTRLAIFTSFVCTFELHATRPDVAIACPESHEDSESPSVISEDR